MTDRLRTATDRAVSAQEARDYLETPVSESEREGVLALVRWFRRRYATPVERLAYVRRTYARWRLPTCDNLGAGPAKTRAQGERAMSQPPRSALLVFVMLAAGSAAAAQTPAPPRMPDGRPNLQGIWQVLTSASWDIQDHSARLGVPAGQGIVEGNDIPYQPWALERKRENFANRATADPDTKGYLPGVPRIMYMPFPFQIVQTPGQVTMTFEYAQGVRVLYTNGTPHPRGPIEWWLGDSRARWEGDTLVVDVVHFTDQTWFDRSGNFHSDALHLVERYTRLGPDHLDYEVTVEDSKVFTRPWKMRTVLYRRREPDVRLLEYVPGLLMDEAQAESERGTAN